MASATAKAVKERPILFSGSMVRAILSGDKTQTRRVMKPTPEFDVETRRHYWPCNTVRQMVEVEDFLAGPDSTVAPGFCPFGGVGDRLWVRETWCRKGEFLGYADAPEHCFYAATDEVDHRVDGDGFIVFRKDGSAASPWSPSIHMPRWASRITLEITGVRVERLQKISESDCWAEGIDAVDGHFDDLSLLMMAKRLGVCIEDAKPTFACLWESINGSGSWDFNPWVWVVAFKRAEVSGA